MITLIPAIWTDEDGEHPVWLPTPPGWGVWERPITPADMEALQQEPPPGRLIGYWPLKTDESEDA